MKNILHRPAAMRRPGLVTTFIILTFTVAIYVLLDPTIHSPVLLREAEIITTASAPLPTTPLAIFDSRQLNSSLPLLRDLYPGGFEPGVLPCNKDATNLLVIIHSAPQHYDRRRAIRTSWADYYNLPLGVRVLFLIGEGGDYDPEKEPFNDVIVAHFIDTYRNLTLKSVAMLDWANKYCPEAPYLLKCDDDVYVNVLKLIVELEMNFDRSNVIIGRIAYSWKPIRDSNSKYFISHEEFAPEVLPNFTTGPAYVVDGGTVGTLLRAALNEPWLSLEDVFLTGLVAGRRTNTSLVHWPTFLNNRATMTVCNAQRLIAIHNVRPQEQLKLIKLSKFSGRSCKMRNRGNKK